MADVTRKIPWPSMLAYAGLMLAIMLLRLMPLSTTPVRWPNPDIMLAVTAAYAVRRPRYVPVGLVAIVFGMGDFLFQAAPGVQAAAVVLMFETLRSRAQSLRAATFPGEWATVALGIFGVFLAERVVLAVFFVPLTPLPMTFMSMLLTIAIYPVVAGLGALVLGLRKRAPGAVDARGQLI